MKLCGKVKPGSQKRELGSVTELRCVSPSGHKVADCVFVQHVVGGTFKQIETKAV